MITYKIHLIRTGGTHSGEMRCYVGQRDLPLSAEGEEELYALRGRFDYPQVEMVFTSPLQRCLRTAGLLFPELPAEELDGLTDMGLGRFEGCAYEDLRDDPAFRAWIQDSAQNPPPGGEGAADFQRRILGAVSDIFFRMMEERMRSVAVVTHGGVILSLLAGICLPKRPLHDWQVGNGTGYTLLFTPQMWMRDGCAEVFRPIPEPREEDGGWITDFDAD